MSYAPVGLGRTGLDIEWTSACEVQWVQRLTLGLCSTTGYDTTGINSGIEVHHQHCHNDLDLDGEFCSAVLRLQLRPEPAITGDFGLAWIFCKPKPSSARPQSWGHHLQPDHFTRAIQYMSWMNPAEMRMDLIVLLQIVWDKIMLSKQRGTPTVVFDGCIQTLQELSSSCSTSQAVPASCCLLATFLGSTILKNRTMVQFLVLVEDPLNWTEPDHGRLEQAGSCVMEFEEQQPEDFMSREKEEKKRCMCHLFTSGIDLIHCGNDFLAHP
ncbi:hypothetical protein BDR05DRAFT_950664 [Suillus weaverae]|nr:hypothetical protein BDR05DRAFT_950664 [Suillus weaverae]